MKTKHKILLPIAGLLIGAANGLFGGGGGMLAVPALRASGLTQKKSHATAIAVMLPLSIISAIVYLAMGNVPTQNLLAISGGVLIGGVLGAVMLKKLSNQALTLLFCVVMIAAGIKMVVGT